MVRPKLADTALPVEVLVFRTLLVVRVAIEGGQSRQAKVNQVPSTQTPLQPNAVHTNEETA
jgi:hypothetical protein